MPPPRRTPTAAQSAAKKQYLTDLARRKAQQAQAAKAASAARQRAQAQQQYYQKRQQQERANAAARRQAEAQQRRVAGEQQARLAEQRRRDAEARRLKSSQARSDAMRKRRTTHRVTRDDTPESIAAQYGIEPSAVGADITRLRPGQQIDIEYQDIRDEQRQGYQPPEAGAGPILPGVAAAGPAFAQQMLKWGTGAMPTVMRALARFGIAAQEPGPLDRALGLEIPEWQQQAGQALEALGPQAAELEGSAEFQRFISGQPTPRADLSAYNVARQVPGGIHDQMAAAVSEAQMGKSLFATTMRYTGQALGYAYDAMISGDPDWQKYISDSDGNIVMALTDGRWDTGPMLENFSPDMLEKIQEMGFVPIEEGLWMVPTLEEAEYGMGGYSFPGYGGGFGGGGGGGDYEYLSRGGVMRRKEGGGVSTGERYRVFPEGVSPAHWRI